MEHSQSFLMLVRQASLGDQDSTRKLLQATSIKLFSYILQLTLDYSLAKRLTKEVQNEIALSLWRLKKPQHFWPRIYAQTWETVKENYLDTRKHKDLFLSDEEEDFFNKQLKTKKERHDAFAYEWLSTGDPHPLQAQARHDRDYLDDLFITQQVRAAQCFCVRP